MHQIAGIAGHLRVLTVEHDLPRLDRQPHFINQGNLEKEGRDVMVSIWSTSMHCQTEVHFGRGRSNHHRQPYHIRGSALASGAGSSSMATRAVPGGTSMRKGSRRVRSALISTVSLYCQTTRRPSAGCSTVIRYGIIKPLRRWKSSYRTCR